MGEFDHVALLTMHHIVSDGWSMGVLMREVASLYHAFSLGLPSPLSDLRVQYADFAHWQRQWLEGEVLERQLTYWKGRLRGLSMLELPTDWPRPPVQTFRGAKHFFQFPSAVSDALGAVSSHRGDDSVHDPARGRPNPSGPLQRPERHCRGVADRQSQAVGNRSAHRFLRQHPGAAHRPLGESELPSSS